MFSSVLQILEGRLVSGEKKDKSKYEYVLPYETIFGSKLR